MRSSTLYSGGSRSRGLGTRLSAQRCTRSGILTLHTETNQTQTPIRSPINAHQQKHRPATIHFLLTCVIQDSQSIVYNMKTFYMLFSLHTQINAEGFALQCFHSDKWWFPLDEIHQPQLQRTYSESGLGYRCFAGTF